MSSTGDLYKHTFSSRMRAYQVFNFVSTLKERGNIDKIIDIIKKIFIIQFYHKKIKKNGSNWQKSTFFGVNYGHEYSSRDFGA